MARVKLAVGATVSVPTDRMPAERGSVRVGVRPEKLHISPDQSANGGAAANSVDAQVMVSTYIGVSTSYECRTSDGSKIVVYVQNLGNAAQPIGAGASVRLSWDPEHTFAVGANGGDR